MVIGVLSLSCLGLWAVLTYVTLTIQLTKLAEQTPEGLVSEILLEETSILCLIQNSRDKAASAGLRRPYLRVVGIEMDSDGPGRVCGAPLTPAEEEEFRQLAAKPDVYETIARSIAPSIYGSVGEWKTIAMLSLETLFSAIP